MAERMVCCLALSLLLGTLHGRVPGLWAAVGMMAFLAYMTAVVRRRCQERAGLVVLLRGTACLLLFYAGASRAGEAQKVFEAPDKAFAKGDFVTVQGQVGKIEEREGQFIYYLKDAQILQGGKAYPTSGILIYSSNPYKPGNVLRAAGAYAPFQISRNEGNFNEKQYYRSKDIGFRVYAQQEKLVSGYVDKYRAFLAKVQKKLRKSIESTMPEEHAGVMANMALGDRSLLGSDLKSLYQSAGISHVLAISGLHVSLVGMGVFKLLRKLRCPLGLASLLAMGGVYSFGALSGMEVSTTRAVCMFLLSMAAQALGYSYDSLTALAFSAGMQVWENPFVLDYAGFLFSYGAVLGAVVVANVLRAPAACQVEGGRARGAGCFHGKEKRTQGEKRLYWEEKRTQREKRLYVEGKRTQGEKSLYVEGKRALGKCMGRVWESFRETLMASVCIQLATLPLSLYFYYECSCYSVAVNACILPFMGILLFLGICGAFVGCFSVVAAKVVFMPASWLFSLFEWLCQESLALPGAALITGKPELFLIALYYFILGAVLCMVYARKERKWVLAIAAALCILLFARGKKQFEIHMLDVGQGDGIFVQTEGGGHFFIDGGSSDVKQVGKYRILPFLKSKGISSIRGWIVSHADQDHINGLEEILESGYPIEYLVLAKGMVQDEAARKLTVLAKEAGCNILYVAAGEKFGAGSVVFTALHPDDGAFSGEECKGSADRNGASLVVSLEYQSFTGIFTGDIGEGQEQEILQKGCLGRYNISNIDFYKAAHHGSNGSNSQEFLDCLSPGLTAISCGEGNSYGHPGAEAMGRIAQAGSKILCTMEKGQISIIPWKGSLRVRTYIP